ncbi:hypothetical protein EDC56_2838 [Sinobacterium caligoides]|uniref:Uncharacterized protein n=1 Tax=Sinobacterium caligoides TaxID=933926 RepID=A0A3N2DK70_9GAMM|nr:hypothetical protein [Sinobacterium caligoides]ROS00200.1 hypothetical protein EDC56_2838 [Sinobacterium caligoides]
MAATQELHWQWPNDRTPDRVLQLTIDDIAPAKSGLFGILRTPSLIANMPEPQVVRGYLTDKPEQTITLTLPKVELGSLTEGDSAALGVIGDNICICVKKLMDGDDGITPESLCQR